MFNLCYHPNGGSGLNFSPEFVLSLSITDLEWYLEQLGDTRQHEAEQIRRVRTGK